MADHLPGANRADIVSIAETVRPVVLAGEREDAVALAVTVSCPDPAAVPALDAGPETVLVGLRKVGLHRSGSIG